MSLENQELETLTRESAVLAERLDERLDLVAGLRYTNIAAGANLRMTAAIERLESFRRDWNGDHADHLTITHLVARSVMLALERDPLFACLFDGRDRLSCPDQPSLGVSVDTGDLARVAVIPEAGRLGLVELSRRIAAETARLKQDVADLRLFADGRPDPVAPASTRRRWFRMFVQEYRERFDFVLPPLQKERFEEFSKEHGHLTLHNLGPLGVNEVKAFLRRPAVAALWVLAAFDRVVPAPAGGFRNERRMSLNLVFSQDIVPEDRACVFLADVVRGLEEPERLAGGER